ncbi:nitrate reductase cytochrome c-type subunit [Campylobacter upsaliensis]
MKNKIFLVSAAAALFLAACAVNNGVSSEQIGLRKANLNNENSVVLSDINYSGLGAGESALLERAFENAPPLISHNLDGMLPITKESNSCLTCHDKAIAQDVGAIAAPASHYYDFRKNKPTGDVISEIRYNCTQCHVAQSDAKPLVGNTFKAEFKNEALKSKSNLLDVMNEGVK